MGGSQLPVAEEAKLKRASGELGWRRAVSTQGVWGGRGSSAPGCAGDVLSIRGRHGGGHEFSQHLWLVVGQVKYGRGLTCMTTRG